MFCKRCGTMLPDDALFCNKCGCSTGETKVEYPKEEVPDCTAADVAAPSPSPAPEPIAEKTLNANENKMPSQREAPRPGEDSGEQKDAEDNLGFFDLPFVSKYKELIKYPAILLLWPAIILMFALSLLTKWMLIPACALFIARIVLSKSCSMKPLDEFEQFPQAKSIVPVLDKITTYACSWTAILAVLFISIFDMSAIILAAALFAVRSASKDRYPREKLKKAHKALIITAAVLLVIIALLAAIYRSSDESADPLEEAYIEVQTALDTGDYEKAHKLLDAAHPTVSPSDARGVQLYFESLSGMEEYEKAALLYIDYLDRICPTLEVSDEQKNSLTSIYDKVSDETKAKIDELLTKIAETEASRLQEQTTTTVSTTTAATTTTVNKERLLEQSRIETAKEIARSEYGKYEKLLEETAFCDSVNYNVSVNELYRNPDKFEGEKVYFGGFVIQTIYSDETPRYVEMRVEITEGGDNDNIIYVGYEIPENQSRILEGDYLDIYGICKGTLTYESVASGMITVPVILAEYIYYDFSDTHSWEDYSSAWDDLAGTFVSLDNKTISFPVTSTSANNYSYDNILEDLTEYDDAYVVYYGADYGVFDDTIEFGRIRICVFADGSIVVFEPNDDAEAGQYELSDGSYTYYKQK